MESLIYDILIREERTVRTKTARTSKYRTQLPGSYRTTTCGRISTAADNAFNDAPYMTKINAKGKN